MFQFKQSSALQQPGYIAYPIVVPITPLHIFSHADISMMRTIEVPELWIVEYALYVYQELYIPERVPDVYDMLFDDITNDFITFDESPNDIRKQRAVAEYSDKIFDLLKRIHQAFAVYIQSLPLTVPAALFASLSLYQIDVEHQETIVVMYVQDGK